MKKKNTICSGNKMFKIPRHKYNKDVHVPLILLLFTEDQIEWQARTNAWIGRHSIIQIQFFQIFL